LHQKKIDATFDASFSSSPLIEATDNIDVALGVVFDIVIVRTHLRIGAIRDRGVDASNLPKRLTHHPGMSLQS